MPYQNDKVTTDGQQKGRLNMIPKWLDTDSMLLAIFTLEALSGSS